MQSAKCKRQSTRTFLHFALCILISAGNGGDNTDRLAIGHLRLDALEMANILIADVDVDEVAQLALVVIELLAELRMLLDQVRQQLADRPARQRHRRGPAGILAQCGWDGNRNSHQCLPYSSFKSSSATNRAPSSASSQAVSSAA